MKKIILIALSVLMFSGAQVFGQGKYGADSANCIKYLSYYKEYYKQKNYDEALPHWRKAYKICPPTANQTMLVDGTSLMRFVINKNRNNSMLKDALVDTLMQIHDVRAEYYPKYAVTALNNKGLDLINYVQDDPQKMYDGCKAIIDANKVETKPQLFLFELNAAVSLYQGGSLSNEDVINDYDTAVSYLDQIIANTPETGLEAVNKVKADVENIFISSKVADCSKLIELFTPRFEANPDSLEIVSKIAKMMSKAEDCTDNELFFQAVNKMYKLDPNGSSAYLIYKLNSSKGNIAEAVKFLEEAISFETETAKKAEYYYELAVFSSKNGQAVKAVDSALKAVELDSSFAGKAYYLCGTIWGSQSCGGNEVQRRSQYWVAVDYLNKAKAADASLSDDANKLIGQYSAYFPQAAEAFMYDVTNGQSYTVSCGGLRATTTVRTQK